MRAAWLRALALALALWAAGPAAEARVSLLGLQNSLIQFALRRISTPERLEITAEGVQEGEDGRAELVGLRVADRDGVWLEIDAVRLRWSPSRILRGELEINELSARGVRVLRRPVGEDVAVEAREPAPARSVFAWPRAPIATRVESVRLEDVRIAAGVLADQAVAFDAAGALRDEGAEQAARLDLTRSDAVAGRIAFDYLRDFGANTLRLSLDADEAAGGLVGELAGFPDDSASRLRLSADGPLTAWRLDLAASADAVFEAEGSATVGLDAPVRVSADLVARPGPAMAEAARAALAPEARLRFDAEEGADGVIRIREGAIRSPELTADLSGTFARENGALDAAARIEAGDGLAALVPGLAFARAGFEGRLSGALADLTAAGALSLDGLRTSAVDVGAARLDATVTVREGRVWVGAGGRAEGLRLDRLAPETVGPAEIELVGDWAGGAATLTRLSLASALLRVEASGRADVGANTAELAYRASAPDLAPVATAYGLEASGAFAASGRLDGPLDAPRLAGEARLDAVRFGEEALGGVRLTHDATLGPAPAGRIDLTAEGSRFGPARIGTAFALAPERLALTDLSAAALGAEATGAVAVALDGGLADGAVDLVAPDLGAVARAADLGALGLGGALTGRVALEAAEGRQDATLDLRLDDAAGFGASLAGLEIAAEARDLRGAPSATGVVTAEGLDHPSARAARLRFEGRAEDLLGAPAAEGRLDAEGLEAGGVAVARLGVEGRGEDLLGEGAAEGVLTAEGITGADLALDRLRAEGAARGWRGALAVEGRVEAEGLDAAGATLARLTAQGRGTDLLGAPEGEATAALERIAAAGFTSDGATLDVTLAQGPGGARLDAAATVEPMTGPPGQIGAVDLRARVDDALAPARRIDAALTLGPSEFGGVALSGASLTARGPQDALDLTAAADGETRAGEALVLDAAARLDLRAPAAPSGVVSRLDARLGEAEARLRAPLRVRSEGGATRLDGIDLALPGGELTGDLARHPDGLSGELALDLPDIGPLARLTEAPFARGALAAAARFDTRRGRARADATVTGRDLVAAFAAGRDLGGLDLDATATWNGARLSAEATVVGPYGQPLTADVAVGMRPGGGLLPELVRGGAVEGRVRWSGRLGDLWARVPAPDHFLDGEAEIDLALSGPLAAPDISGDVSLRNGRYEYLVTGTILTDLEIGSRVAPGGAFEVTLSARDGADAPVAGVVRFADGVLDARVESRNAVLVRRDDVTAEMTVDVRAAGPLTAPTVSGAVEIERAEVRLVDATPPSVASLGEVRIKGEPPPEPREAREGAVALDLRVRADDRIFVRGRGLDSEWRADVAIGGTAAAPVVTGAVEKIRGVLNLVGAVFQLERGAVRFTGGLPVDPRLDVALFRENRGVRGGVIVRGTVSAPEIGFESTPPLPESEVLPRVLFGTSQQSLSAGQAVQLALGLATLLDGSGGALDAARATLGVDVLRFEEEQILGDGEKDRTRQTVTVGSNVADGVFVGAVQPIDGGAARVRVEIEVFENITVDTEIGTEDQSSVGVNWRKDF